MKLTPAVHGKEIYAISDTGVHLLTELFCEEVYLCLQVGSNHPEEGWGHYLLDTLEYLTGRTYLHGATVTLGALMMAYLQGNAPNELRTRVDACGAECCEILAEVGEDALVSGKQKGRHRVKQSLPPLCLPE